MTYPRAHLVDAENGGTYHCISRCVRRGWLCGEDVVSGRSFEHRRGWVEGRLLRLAGLFAVELHGYAVMSNHYHVVIETVPRRAREWDDEEVARRWCALSAARDGDEVREGVTALLGNPARIAELRVRLASLSWFMRYINEPIARRANREDGVTGRFWEGRFKSIALLDEAAVVACMAYVDLNPVRAKAAETVEDAVHTSIGRRLRHRGRACAPLAPLSAVGLTLASYRQLLAWTAAVDQGGVEPPAREARSALRRLEQRPEQWLGRVKAHRFKYRAYGALRTLEAYASALGQRWLCGARPGLAAPD